MLISASIPANQVSRNAVIAPERQELFICIDTDSALQPTLQVHLIYHHPPRMVANAEFDPDIAFGIINLSFSPTTSLKSFINQNGIEWESGNQISLQIVDKTSNIKIWQQDYNPEDNLYNARIVVPTNLVSELINLLINKPSSLHLKMIVHLQQNRHERILTALYPLRKVMGNHVKQALIKDPHKYIRQHYLNTDQLKLVEFYPTPRERLTTGRATGAKPTKMMYHKNQWTPLPNMHTPVKTVPIQPAMIAQASFLASTKLWNYGSLLATKDSLPSKDIPLLTDNEDKIWPDLSIVNQYWYLPTVHLLLPGSGETLEQSPFHLNFVRKGSAPDGSPILEGTLKLTIQFTQPVAVAEHAISRPGAIYKPITITSKQFSIRLPIMDSDGRPQTSLLQPTSVDKIDDKIRLVFQLTNLWIRACYGVLSIDGYQTSKATLLVNLGFTAMRKKIPSKGTPLYPLSIGKLSAMKINRNFRSIASMHAMPINKILANQISPIVKPLPKEDEVFTLEQFSKQQETSLFIPCSAYGSYFTEQTMGGISEPIGCHEPYRLGEFKFQLYEPVESLSHIHYNIYRSLQSPGQFLIVPKIYRIGRFDFTHPQYAGKPCIHLYGALDESDQFQQSRAYITISMQPDISAIEWYRLNEKLSEMVPESAQIFFPGEIAASSVFRWNLPSGVAVETLAAGRDITASFSMDVMQVLALQEMIERGVFQGIGTYTLPDGKTYSVQLQPDTSRICGPWLQGPVQITIDGNQIQFKNQIEKETLVSGIIGLNAKGEKILDLSLQLSLKSGDLTKIETSTPVDSVIADILTSNTPSPINETWVFVDDVEAEVLFQTDLDFQSAQISRLTIVCKPPLPNATEDTLELDNKKPSSEKLFFIPLTHLSQPREISYRFKASGAAGESQWSQWLKHDLSTEGSLVWIKSQQVLSLFTS